MKNWLARGDKGDFLWVFLLLILHHFVEGYSFGVNDHVIEIPI